MASTSDHRTAPTGVEDLTPEQRYLGAETVDHAREGLIDRREMGRRLVLICGSAAAATALLAACGGDDGAAAPSSTAPSGSSGPSSTAASPATSAAPGTTAATATTAASGPATTNAASSGRAALSVAADDPAVRGEAVTFAGPAGTVFGYAARPSAAGTRPAVLVIHEIFGLTDHIRDVARRLAKAGYLALAVDLTSRAGGIDKVGAGGVSGALAQTKPEDMVADLQAAGAYLARQSDFGGTLGVTGFCFGGGMTLRLAANEPSIAAAVAYYGPNPTPVSMMSNTKAALLAHYGGTDSRVNAGIADLEAAMAGKTFEKVVWDGAGHAFNNDTGGAYQLAAAVGAWTRTLDWFARHLR